MYTSFSPIPLFYCLSPDKASRSIEQLNSHIHVRQRKKLKKTCLPYQFSFSCLCSCYLYFTCITCITCITYITCNKFSHTCQFFHYVLLFSFISRESVSLFFTSYFGCYLLFFSYYLFPPNTVTDFLLQSIFKMQKYVLLYFFFLSFVKFFI